MPLERACNERPLPPRRPTGWEQASRAGGYASASLHDNGFLRCFTAAQHAAVANARFAGRGDLVLLLIDTDKLASRSASSGRLSRVRHSRRCTGQWATTRCSRPPPTGRGPDGWFHPHEEAGGFAAHGATTLGEAARRAVETMAGFDGRWWVAGGWALDLFVGHKMRPHADLEISVLASGQATLFEQLRGWDVRLAAPGASLPAWDGSRIQPPFHQVWARHGPARSSGPEEFAADPTMLGFLLEQGGAGRWAYRRHPTVTRPLDELGAATADGVPFVRPEIALLFKAKAPRFKDQRDFDRVVPHLDGPARAWLAAALGQAHPRHPWRGRL